ncbi:MAG: tetratricopeptide repeat protein [Syntrophales bacterium]
MNENNNQGRRSFLVEMEPYFERNESQIVLNLAQERLKRIPDDLDSRIAICRVWLQQGRIDEARDMLGEMEDILSGLSQLYACMGDLYTKKGLADEAELFYRKFTALNPASSPALDSAVRLKEIGALAEADDYERGEEEGENSDVFPDFGTVTLAELYIRQGHLPMAEEMLEKITGRDPQNERAGALLQDVRARLGKKAGGQKNAGVIVELARWLENIGNLRRHAA